MGKEVKCTVKDLISFEALEKPPWRTSPGLSVTNMLKDIMEFHRRWKEAKLCNTFSVHSVENVKFKFLVDFIHHINSEEELGVSTREEIETCLGLPYSELLQNLKWPLSIKEQETVNLKEAYSYVLETVQREESDTNYGLLETSLIKEIHREILKGIPVPHYGTRPGEMSDRPRYCEFNGETYYYQHPDNMKAAVDNLIDHYNELFDFITRNGLTSLDNYYNLFKTCAWLVFELLDLHPFGDGNGRLCRILCSYSLSMFTPFPSPIYNVWTNSSKNDYKEALVEARKSASRRPCALTTMIIECNWHGWRKFFECLDEDSTVDTTIPYCENLYH